MRSIPIRVPGHERRVFIAGRIDAALEFDDGSFGIVDFKTSVPKPEHVAFYGRQLPRLRAGGREPGAREPRTRPPSSGSASSASSRRG